MMRLSCGAPLMLVACMYSCPHDVRDLCWSYFILARLSALRGIRFTRTRTSVLNTLLRIMKFTCVKKCSRSKCQWNICFCLLFFPFFHFFLCFFINFFIMIIMWVSSHWFLITVVFHRSGFSSQWSFITVVFCQGCNCTLFRGHATSSGPIVVVHVSMAFRIRHKVIALLGAHASDSSAVWNSDIE